MTTGHFSLTKRIVPIICNLTFGTHVNWLLYLSNVLVFCSNVKLLAPCHWKKPDAIPGMKIRN